MTPEDAYEEALRIIREAEETGALELVRSHRTWNIESTAARVGTPHLDVPRAQRRSIPAGQSHLAPIARPLLVLAAPQSQFCCLQTEHSDETVVHLGEQVSDLSVVGRVLSRLVHVAITIFNDRVLISVSSLLG
jgi:hypothetical protein